MQQTFIIMNNTEFKKLSLSINHGLCGLLLVFFSNIGNVFAQDNSLRFSHLTVKDGLSQNVVNSILQDYQGFIWICTNGGLNRYDGINFKVYRHNPSLNKSISDNTTNSLFEDSKKNLWVTTIGNGLNLFNREMDNWIVFRHNPSDVNTLSSDDISFVCEDDSTGNLWISSYHGLNYFDSQSKKFHRFLPTDTANVFKGKKIEGQLYRNDVVSLLKPPQEPVLWIGYGNKIGKFLINENRFEVIDLYFQDHKVSNSGAVYSIFKDSKNRIWAGTELYGLFVYDSDNKRFNNYVNSDGSVSKHNVKVLFEDRQNNLWIGYNGNGLGRINLNTGVYSHYKEDTDSPNGLRNNTIYCINQSKDGILWFGAFGDGINILDKNSTKFELYRHLPNSFNSLKNSHVREFYEDSEKTIWVGTRSGIDLFNPVSRKFTRFASGTTADNLIGNDIILSIFEDPDKQLWIGTFTYGLFCFNKKTRGFRQFLNNPNDTNSISSNHVYKLYTDTDNSLWVGTLDGLNKYDKANDKFIRYDLKGIIDMVRDDKGNLLVASSHGLYLMKQGQASFEKIWTQSGREQIYCICIDSRKNLWIGTLQSGLLRLNDNYEIVNIYTTNNGLPENKIVGILEDNKGNLWLSTSRGLSKFEINTERFVNYDVNDGLQDNEFYSSAFLKAADGKIYFGGIDGFNAFYPEEIKYNDYIPKLVFTNFRIFNKEVPIGKNNSPLSKTITQVDEITLNYKQSSFAIDFAALNFTLPEKNQYAYFLEGFDSQKNGWNYIGHEHTASFTNLPPGNYVLKVIASNNDLRWNNTGISLRIIITPPIWETWYAKVLYILIILGGIIVFQKFTIIRTKLKNDLKIEHIERQKNDELNQAKLSFFTNISHEFRTPLTLMLGPLDTVLKQMANDSALYHQLLMVQRNTKTLFNLVNQLLDFRKLETGKMNLCYKQGNLIQFIEYIYNNFKDYSERRTIKYTFFKEREEIISWFDPDAIEKILNNIISNAFKYTNDGSDISVMLNYIPVTDSQRKKWYVRSQEPVSWLLIIVKDSGVGIPDDKIGRIFELYYRNEYSEGLSKLGSGIGLAFTKNLVELIGGEIKVESELGKGSRFYIKLPIVSSPKPDKSKLIEYATGEVGIQQTNTFFVPEIGVKNDSLENVSINNEDNSTVIQIIDDNEDMRTFIGRHFQQHYKTIESVDGEDGLKTALKVIPDIIVCDIMMPGMDGIELCSMLKNNELTSHIPIILLTAKSAMEYRIEGYKTGADSYITKPFELELLEARIHNLLETRNTLREKYNREITLEPSQTLITSKDELFLQKMGIFHAA